MGSFNLSCGLSGCSISPGDKCIYIPLELTKYPISTKSLESIIPDKMCQAWYRPSDLPIYGEYDDYGNLDSHENVMNGGAIFLLEIINNCLNKYNELSFVRNYKDKDFIRFKQACDEYKELVVNAEEHDFFKGQLVFFDNGHDYRNIIIKYKDGMTHDQINELCKISRISCLMYSVHRLWLPAVFGPQCGERDAELLVFEESANFSRNKIKEYDGDY